MSPELGLKDERTTPFMFFDQRQPERDTSVPLVCEPLRRDRSDLRAVRSGDALAVRGARDDAPPPSQDGMNTPTVLEARWDRRPLGRPKRSATTGAGRA